MTLNSYYMNCKLPPGNEAIILLFKECENLYFPFVKFIQIWEKLRINIYRIENCLLLQIDFHLVVNDWSTSSSFLQANSIVVQLWPSLSHTYSNKLWLSRHGQSMKITIGNQSIQSPISNDWSAIGNDQNHWKIS